MHTSSRGVLCSGSTRGVKFDQLEHILNEKFLLKPTPPTYLDFFSKSPHRTTVPILVKLTSPHPKKILSGSNSTPPQG